MPRRTSPYFRRAVRKSAKACYAQANSAVYILPNFALSHQASPCTCKVSMYLFCLPPLHPAKLQYFPATTSNQGSPYSAIIHCVLPNWTTFYRILLHRIEPRPILPNPKLIYSNLCRVILRTSTLRLFLTILTKLEVGCKNLSYCPIEFG